MLRPTKHSLIHSTAALTLVIQSMAGTTLAQEQLVMPDDDAPAESFPSMIPSLGTEQNVTSSFPEVQPLTNAIPNIGGGIWLAKGPGPAIGGQVENINGPNEVVGAVHALAAHPTNPNILYLGGTNGGVWKTNKALSTKPMWEPLTDDKTSLSIGALEFDPTDSMGDTLVAGIGRYSSFAQRGGSLTGKLLKTTDSGMSFNELAGFIGAFSAAGISGVAPRGPVIVASVNISEQFFCNDIGLWRSIDSGTTFSQLSFSAGLPVGVAFDLTGDLLSNDTLYTGITFGLVCSNLPNGIYKSTDTGASWTKVSDAAMDAFIIDGTTNNIEIAAYGDNVYANIIQDGRPVGIFHSGNGGTTWSAMDLPRTPEGAPSPIANVIPGSPITINTGTPHGLNNSGMEVDISGVTGTVGANGVSIITATSATTFTLNGSSDFTPWGGGGTWNKVVGLSPKAKPGGQGGIHAAIRIKPTTPTTVYLGGDRQDFPFPNFLGALDFSGRLFRGDTTVSPTGSIPSPQWEHLTHSKLIASIPNGGTPNSSAPHADAREMVFNTVGDLIESDDGGIYRRTNPTNNNGEWFSINGNLQVTEQHDIAYDSLSNIIISGNQDTGTTQQQTTNGLTWDSVSTADGGDVAVDDLSVPGVSTRYSSFQNLGAFRRREYDAANGLVSEVFPTLTLIGVSPSPVANFVTPVVLNTITPTSLVIGASNAIYESFDKGDSINALSGTGVTSSSQNAIAYGGVKGGVPNPDVLWVGSGSVVKLRTAPAPAALAATPTAFPGTTVTDIVLDPTDWGTAYVTDTSDVYMTHDSGGTWTAITGNLSDTQLRSAVIDPAPPARLFVGGREGVAKLALPTPGVVPSGPFVWGEIGTGLPNAPVWDMEWDATDNILVVGTLGRGTWVLQENGFCGKPDFLVVNNQWVEGIQLDEACTQITAGPSLDVTATGDLTLRAPTIIFGSGFSVKLGGKLTAGTAP